MATGLMIYLKVFSLFFGPDTVFIPSSPQQKYPLIQADIFMAGARDER